MSVHMFSSFHHRRLTEAARFYVKLNNPLAHEVTTGPEIIEAVVSTASTLSKPSSEKVDVFIAGAGTGGTITGISKAIKKTHNPECIVVGVDPASFPSVFILPLLSLESSTEAFSHTLMLSIFLPWES